MFVTNTTKAPVFFQDGKTVKTYALAAGQSGTFTDRIGTMFLARGCVVKSTSKPVEEKKSKKREESIWDDISNNE